MKIIKLKKNEKIINIIFFLKTIILKRYPQFLSELIIQIFIYFETVLYIFSSS